MRLNPFSNKTKVFASSNDLANVAQTSLSTQYTTPGMLARSAYDNGFAPISAICDEISKRNIHLGNLTNPDSDVSAQYQFWNTMIRPNDRMGFMQFIDTLVAGFLSKSEMSLLLWHPNGNNPQIPGAPEGGFTLDTIGGFTIVPDDCKGFTAQNEEEWQIDFGSAGGGLQKFYRDSIITLKYSLLPDDGVTGVSPGSASAQEAAIRDRLNQYERAMFDNGATPSLIVTIHARTHDEYKSMQQAFEKANRGASKAQGVVYQSVIDSGNAMLAGTAQPHIEVTVVGTTNSNLAISEIVDFTQTTITSNYGVSPIIYGDATTTTFQNQNLADNKFMGRVQAILVRLFSSFENELARICKLSELPFTFVWDDVELDIVEEQKLKAEVNTEQVRAFVGLVQSGATPEQAAVVLGLNDDWKMIAVKPAATPDLAPQQPSLNMGLKPLMLEGCTCPDHQENRAFTPKRISETEQTAQKKILNLLKKIAQQIFDKRSSNATGISELDQQFIDELTNVMRTGAEVTGAQIVNEASLDLVLADFGGLSKQSVSRLEKRATKVVTNYKDFVTEKLDAWSDQDTKDVFSSFYSDKIESRSSLISQQETKNAYQNGELDGSENIDKWLRKNQPLSYIIKTWTTTSDKPCRFCKKMDGTEAGIKDSFIPGGLIDAGDVSLRLDPAYGDGTIPDAHANCQCVFKFSLKSK